ncbi:lytic polysaccharide monooxygenase [Amycolatopsis sp. EV170708-02-1]|uniref:lytic polysaccharide monooxygenase auxiliary activity family 9 protein n=1 Tax=Amycolatopsis sp. EV170708-02-1 TaxID=2919322 RepID=UPI001F0C607D|nr:lytic polysaccharide monooxygenase [Amycolatopsis sp. EV170708-02-1]UMP05585.1 lytic polysaccharide monooxygenase [Amycolatopsis sp. EV170708-02-1]
MRRRKAMTAILAVVTTMAACLVTATLNAPSASAHGALMKPGSRTFFCWQDGLTPQGNIVGKNSACKAAVAQSGENSLYNWFSVLRSDGAGRTEGFIPDGQLCSGGNPNFAGYDRAGNWPVTHLTAGASFGFSYNAWAAHPGWFFLYVTKDGYDPSRPLRWDDLEEQPFLTVDHPQVSGNVGSVDGQYKWTGSFPAAKSGKHVVYSVWKRSDSTETFYGCSDVVFDGGNGEVTGVGVVDDPPDPGEPPNGACTAKWTTTGSWNGGYQAEVTVTNPGTTTLSGWRVGWTVPAGQTISSVWNGTLTLDGARATVGNAGWNGSLPAGTTRSFGLSANATGSIAAPELTCASP